MTQRWVGAVPLMVLGWCAAVCAGGAQAQEPSERTDKSELLRSALVVGKTAYVPLPAEVVCGPQVLQICSSPTSTDALIVKSVMPPDRRLEVPLEQTAQDRLWEQLQAGGVESEILLWGPTSRRALTIWRRNDSITAGYTESCNVTWLGGNRIALVNIVVVLGPLTRESLDDPDHIYRLSLPTKKEHVLLRVNAQTGLVETLPTSETDYRVLVSPDGTTAMLSNPAGNVIRLVGTKGAVTLLPVPLEEEEVVEWKFWLPDGKRLRGVATHRGADSNFIFREIILDTVTGQVQTANTADKATNTPPPTNLTLAPFRLRRGASVALEEGYAHYNLVPLWLEAQEQPTVTASGTSRTLIAADADPASPTATLLSSVLYQRQGILFAAPLATLSADQLLTLRHRQYLRDTHERAARIAGTIRFLIDGVHQLPRYQVTLDKLATFLPDPRTFQNPEIGLNGFTLTYPVLAPTEGLDQHATPFGFLKGPDGRAVIYLDGHVVWEETCSAKGTQ